MYRYFIELSYIGTRFRGMQKNVNKQHGVLEDASTVQGCLEQALKAIRPINSIETVVSSRTDAGVHALHTTVHVDLECANGQPYDVQSMIGTVNRIFDKKLLPIRILDIRIVPNTFHCRYHAIGRSYLYRFAVVKKEISAQNITEIVKNRNYKAYVPIEEINRCLFMQNDNFDIERMKAAAGMFIGFHDFRTFMSSPRSNTRDHPMFSLRSIDDIRILPSRTTAIDHHATTAEQYYNYWEFHISGKSFLHNQVRRIVGALITVAINRVSEKHLYEMLTIPSTQNWDPRVLVSPPYGLYLRRVNYNISDFVTPRDLTLPNELPRKLSKAKE